jgi:hypothetical protein
MSLGFWKEEKKEEEGKKHKHIGKDCRDQLGALKLNDERTHQRPVVVAVGQQSTTCAWSAYSTSVHPSGENACALGVLHAAVAWMVDGNTYR